MTGVALLKDRIAKIDSFKARIDTIVREELTKEQVFISSLLRKQLIEGKKGDGTDMPDYVEGSKQPSAPGKITLFAFGRFHDGIEPLFEQNHFNMVGLDGKTDLMIWAYGESILKLLPENIQLLANRIRPRIMNRILLELV